MTACAMKYLRDNAKFDFATEVHGSCDDSWGQYGCIAVAVGPQGEVGRPLNSEAAHMDQVVQAARSHTHFSGLSVVEGNRLCSATP